MTAQVVENVFREGAKNGTRGRARSPKTKKARPWWDAPFVKCCCGLGVGGLGDLGSGGFVAIFHRCAAAEFDAAFVVNADI